MAILKDFKCNTCGKEQEVLINIKEPNPKCECGSDTYWLPKPNHNPPQFSYSLRVICDGFDTKNVHERVV